MYKARRVIRTESNYCINQSELKGMKDAGFDEYEFISLGEEAEDVFDTCDDLDGERFKISEAAVGVNCPPMHPFCRCKVTTPQETLEDIQADIDRMLEGTSIEEIEQRLDQMITEREQIGTTENSAESVDNFDNRGIIEVGNEETTENDMLILSSKFINPNDELYRYADRIDPEPGFSDIVCHGDPHFLLIHGMDGEEWEYSAKQAAEMIKNSNEFKGEPIRLIACQTGAEENGIAQQISDILKVPVKAPTESVYVNLKGEMFITDNAFLADLWEKGGNVQETGKWTMFYPREE